MATHVSASASAKTVFNEILADAFELLKSGENNVFSRRSLEGAIDELVRVDASGAWELRGYLAAVKNSFEEADENFAKALRLSPSNVNVVVRWLAMLSVTGQAKKVESKFAEHREHLRGDLAAMSAVVSLLGYVGLLYDAYLLREELVSMGGTVLDSEFEGDFGIAAPQVVGRIDGALLLDQAEPLPCSQYSVNADDTTVLLDAYGLKSDAWSAPVGSAISFLRGRKIKVIAVKSSFVPHDNLPATVHVQILVCADAVKCSEAEWDYYERVSEKSFEVISIGAASMAFIPTLEDADNAHFA
jgi:hypothetical protein